MGSKKQEIISLIEEMDEEGLDKLLYFIKLQLKKKIIFNGDKGSILDLKVKTERGERINIEVQLNNVDDFRKRSLYYCSKMYAETIQEGETYTNLRKSIVINLIDFDLIDETERCHTIYKIIETEEKFELTDDLEIHYIELKKIEKQLEREINVGELEGIELWLTFIKKTGEEGTEKLLKSLIERSETIKMAEEMLKKISGDELLRQKYYASEKARLDEISRIKYAEIKGMEKGMEKGELKRAREMAKKALTRGWEVEEIAETTGLSKEEVERIKEEI